MFRNGRLMGVLLLVMSWAFLSFQAVAAEQALPDPKTSGIKGGPVSVLFLQRHRYTDFDETYAKELDELGYQYAKVNANDPLTPEFLKQFNIYVIEQFPAPSAYYAIFGQQMLVFDKNMEMIMANVKQGAGLLVYGALLEINGSVPGFNQRMKSMGMTMKQATVMDRSLGFSTWTCYGVENCYCWTENLAKHPLMEGLKRIYYAAGISRYDDFFLAPPLVGDKSWTPIVKAMKGARVVTPRLLGADGILGWVDEADSQPEPVLASVRTLDKGRIGVVSMDVIYTHAYGYCKPKNGTNIGEHAVGALEGAILKKGDGRVPSDTGALIARMYAWLGAGSAQAGFGGYKTEDKLPTFEAPKYPEELSFKPVIDIDNFKPLPSWKHRTGLPLEINEKKYYPQISDPFVPGDVKFFKALIGAHSEFSDGTGTVEEWAKAAKEAGYDAIVF
ncbi:MAG: hypothetical protein WCP55_08950, partial [Lentisphaerota bacterium]